MLELKLILVSKRHPLAYSNPSGDILYECGSSLIANMTCSACAVSGHFGSVTNVWWPSDRNPTPCVNQDWHQPGVLPRVTLNVIRRATLILMMACCLMVPSHYLNQCWLIIIKVLWHSPEGIFTGNAKDIFPSYEFENYQFNITAASPLVQWVNKSKSLYNIGGLVQERCKSIAYTLELRLSCTNPSICSW